MKLQMGALSLGSKIILKDYFDAASKINILIPYSMDEVSQAQKEAMLKNNLSEGYIRPIVFLGSESMGLRSQDSLSVNVAIACWEWPSYMDPEARKEWHLSCKISISAI